MSDQSSVLFVCMGNICRSPAAEGVMRHLVAQRGLEERLHIDSAGTLGYHAGASPDPRMREAASERGYRLTGRARQFDAADFDSFDLIVAMDRDNFEEIRALDPRGQHHQKVKLLSDFLPKRRPRDVPDPYYGGPAGFERVLDMVEEGCKGILERLLSRR